MKKPVINLWQKHWASHQAHTTCHSVILQIAVQKFWVEMSAPIEIQRWSCRRAGLRMDHWVGTDCMHYCVHRQAPYSETVNHQPTTWERILDRCNIHLGTNVAPSKQHLFFKQTGVLCKSDMKHFSLHMLNEQTHSAVIQKFTIISGDWDFQIGR